MISCARKPATRPEHVGEPARESRSQSVASINANIQLVDTVYLWASIVFLLVVCAALYILPSWIRARLLLARKQKRRAAVATLLRISWGGDHEDSTTKQAWLIHLFSWRYPALFVGSSLSIRFRLYARP